VEDLMVIEVRPIPRQEVAAMGDTAVAMEVVSTMTLLRILMSHDVEVGQFAAEEVDTVDSARIVVMVIKDVVVAVIACTAEDLLTGAAEPAARMAVVVMAAAVIAMIITNFCATI